MSSSLPRLKISKGEAIIKLKDRITRLEEIKKAPLNNSEQITLAESQYKKWSEYTGTLLLNLLILTNFIKNM